MNKKFKQFICGIVVATLLFGSSVPALALTLDEELDFSKNITDTPGYAESKKLTEAYMQAGKKKLLKSNALPEKFDLRFDYPLDSERKFNPITSVKNQSPWGTCWAFSAIASAESNINRQTGKVEDLSEMQLSAFNFSHMSEAENFSQAGEGIWSDEGMNVIDLGGFDEDAMWLFSIGVGPETEAQIPYWGLKQGKASFDTDADWTLPASQKLRRKYNFAEARFLPATAYYADFVTYSFNAEGVKAMKEELIKGNAVSTSYFADNYTPSKTTKVPYFINTEDKKYAHYTWKEDLYPNHVVTVVGWDDTYSKENFLSEATDPKTGRKVTDIQPPEDGAWIVKNSWGYADADNDHDRKDWGTDDTGYFYLSYYDTSMSCCNVVYDFNVEASTKNETIHQYDTNAMMANEISYFGAKEVTKAANVFKTDVACEISALATRTFYPDTTVDYFVYLNEDENSAPDSGQLVGQVTEHFPEVGFHKTFLDEPISVPEGKTYSVITQMRQSDEIIVSAPLYASNDELQFGEYGFTTQSVINPGESFYYDQTNDQWIDLHDEKQEIEKNSYATLDNFSIKSYTVPCSHRETTVKNARVATCTRPGYSGNTHCKNCGKLISRGKMIPAKGHSYGKWTGKGITQKRVCTLCGHAQTRTNPGYSRIDRFVVKMINKIVRLFRWF